MRPQYGRSKSTFILHSTKSVQGHRGMVGPLKLLVGHTQYKSWGHTQSKAVESLAVRCWSWSRTRYVREVWERVPQRNTVMSTACSRLLGAARGIWALHTSSFAFLQNCHCGHPGLVTSAFANLSIPPLILRLSSYPLLTFALPVSQSLRSRLSRMLGMPHPAAQLLRRPPLKHLSKRSRNSNFIPI